VLNEQSSEYYAECRECGQEIYLAELHDTNLDNYIKILETIRRR
jgi:hypothetical protein